MERPFTACPFDWVRRTVEGAITFRKLPEPAEKDVRVALGRVAGNTQTLFVRAAEDGGVPDRVAMNRLACLWVSATAVNLADDLADGDCDYLEPEVAPGVSFLLQALAGLFAARSGLSERCHEDFSIGLVKAAAGQSLEVRTTTWIAAEYERVGTLIAGQQYAAYFRLLWDGTDLETASASIGTLVGQVALVVTDIGSADPRFSTMPVRDRALVVERCRRNLQQLDDYAIRSLREVTELARATLAGYERATS